MECGEERKIQIMRVQDLKKVFVFAKVTEGLCLK